MIPNAGTRSFDRYNLFTAAWGKNQAFVSFICISEPSTIQPHNERRIEKDNLVLLIRSAQGFPVDIPEELNLHQPDIPFHQRAAAVMFRGLELPTNPSTDIQLPQYKNAVTFATVRYEGRSGKFHPPLPNKPN